MRRWLSLSLDEFGASALEDVAERFPLSPAELALHAAPLLPRGSRFRPAGAARARLAAGDAGDRALRLRLDLDADTWREFEAEASREDVSVDALVRHAIFYLLANLDSGRAARRILED